MHSWYKKKLLTRLNEAWSDSTSRVVDVEEVDTKTWLITFESPETGERTQTHRLKSVLRKQEGKLRKSAVQEAESELMGKGQMSSPVKIVNACPDTLVLNCYPTNGAYQVERRDMPMALRGELEQLKKLAQDKEEPIPTRFVFNGFNLKMMAKGGDGFNWILKNGFITLAVNRSSKMVLWAQVRCSSEYLQMTHDLGRVVCDVHLFLMSIFGQYIIPQPSSLDLAVDVVFLDLGSIQDVKRHFVSRAQLTGEIPGHPDDGMIDGPDQIKQRWGRLTGLPFGARKGALSAIIYDKTHEIKYQSPEKAYMHEIWRREAEKQGFTLEPDAQAWRIEIRYKRQALNEMKQEGVFHGIDDAYTLEGHIPGLWSYAVGHVGGGEDGLPDGWLRYVIPSEDKNRSRWQVHPDWQVVQTAFMPEQPEETEYERELREQEELLRDLDEYLTEHPHAPDRSVLMPFSSSDEPIIEVMTSSNKEPVASSLWVPPPLDLAPYVRERKREVNLRRLVAQIAGCTVTAEAWRHATVNEVEPDISDTFQFLYGQVEAYLIEKERDFTQLVHKKRVLYDLEQQLVDLDQAIA